MRRGGARWLGWAHLMARYIGRMAKRGKVCTLIMMVMKAMYRSTLMKPGEKGAQRAAGHGLGGNAGTQRGRAAQAPLTCEELRVEHVHSLVVPGVFALEVHGVQDVLDEDGEHHGHQDGVLWGAGAHQHAARPAPAALSPPGLCPCPAPATLSPPGLCTAGCDGAAGLGHSRGPSSSSTP